MKEDWDNRQAEVSNADYGPVTPIWMRIITVVVFVPWIGWLLFAVGSVVISILSGISPTDAVEDAFDSWFGGIFFLLIAVTLLYPAYKGCLDRLASPVSFTGPITFRRVRNLEDGDVPYITFGASLRKH